MTALRQLSLVYVAAAGTYALAMTMSAHPDWARNAQFAASHFCPRCHETAAKADRAAVAFDTHIAHPAWDVIADTGLAMGEGMARAAEAPPAQSEPRRPLEFDHTGKRQMAVARRPSPPALRGVLGPSQDESIPMPPRKDWASQPRAASPKPDPSPDTASSLPSEQASDDAVRVTKRLKDGLTPEMFENFELFLYVSKADSGPWAQHMYVLQKRPDGDLALLHKWRVSTGRERIEFNPEGRRVRTVTPSGYYELDPDRSYVHYRSSEWGASMPYAMFFNWVKNGHRAGLAIHAAVGDDTDRLGRRASAGCIHLSRRDARMLFTMIRSDYRGLAPRFAIDPQTGTMSNDGILLRDPDGRPQMAEGYKVLVFIEDYGGQTVVAALY